MTEPRYLTVDEALAMLPDPIEATEHDCPDCTHQREQVIHTMVGSGGIVIGADNDREHVIQMIRDADRRAFNPSGAPISSHALGIPYPPEGRKPLWIEVREGVA